MCGEINWLDIGQCSFLGLIK